MFKKFLSISALVFLFSFFLASHSSAFTLPGNNCNATTTSYNITVVAPGTSIGTIPLCVSALGNFPVTVRDNIFGTPFYTINSNPTLANIFFDYPQGGFITLTAPVDLNVPKIYNFFVTDSTNQGSNANAILTLVPATIHLVITDVTTGQIVPQGGDVHLGDNLNFHCTDALYMYLDNTSGNNPAIVSYNTNSSYYVLDTNDATLPLGLHTVGCTNVGTPTNDVSQYFHVIKDGTYGDITAPDCIIQINASSCTTTVNWHTYNPTVTSAVTSETDGNGNSSPNNLIQFSLNGPKYNVNIPYIVLGSHQGRHFYLYNNAVQLAQATSIAECIVGSTWDGNKCAVNNPDPNATSTNATSTNVCNTPTGSVPNGSGGCICPNGYIPSAGVCVPVCPTNSAIPASNASCTCLTGQVLYGGACVPACSTNTAIPASDPTCSTSGAPYTHFLSFNVSGGYVPKGSAINLNWSIQKPNDTCMIVGKAINLNTNVFTMNKDNNTQLASDILNTKLLSPGKTLSFVVNQSTRFVASCINDSAINTGYHQFVRDVYVIGEKN